MISKIDNHVLFFIVLLIYVFIFINSITGSVHTSVKMSVNSWLCVNNTVLRSKFIPMLSSYLI